MISLFLSSEITIHVWTFNLYKFQYVSSVRIILKLLILKYKINVSRLKVSYYPKSLTNLTVQWYGIKCLLHRWSHKYSKELNTNLDATSLLVQRWRWLLLRFKWLSDFLGRKYSGFAPRVTWRKGMYECLTCNDMSHLIRNQMTYISKYI